MCRDPTGNCSHPPTTINQKDYNGIRSGIAHFCSRQKCEPNGAKIECATERTKKEENGRTGEIRTRQRLHFEYGITSLKRLLEFCVLECAEAFCAPNECCE